MCCWCTGKYFSSLYFYHLQFSRCRMGANWRIQVWSWIMTPHSRVEFAVRGELGKAPKSVNKVTQVLLWGCSSGVDGFRLKPPALNGWSWIHPQGSLDFLSSLGQSHFRHRRFHHCVSVTHLQIPLSIMFLSPMSQYQWISPGFNATISWWKLLIVHTILFLLQFWLVVGSLCQFFVVFVVCKKWAFSGLTNQRWGNALFFHFYFF